MAFLSQAELEALGFRHLGRSVKISDIAPAKSARAVS